MSATIITWGYRYLTYKINTLGFDTWGSEYELDVPVDP